MAKFLRIAQWNANGLAQHKGEVQLFLQQNKIDILLVSETHFTTTFKYRNTKLITPINRSRCHPQKKQQAPSQTTISSKPTSTIPIKEQYPTETATKMAN
jgi:exonuclease III